MRPRDRPALTCRQCRLYGRCMGSYQLRPCTDFIRHRDMSAWDWILVGMLIIGIYAGMIVTYIALA